MTEVGQPFSNADRQNENRTVSLARLSPLLSSNYIFILANPQGYFETKQRSQFLSWAFKSPHLYGLKNGGTWKDKAACTKSTSARNSQAFPSRENTPAEIPSFRLGVNHRKDVKYKTNKDHVGKSERSYSETYFLK